MCTKCYIEEKENKMNNDNYKWNDVIVVTNYLNSENKVSHELC